MKQDIAGNFQTTNVQHCEPYIPKSHMYVYTPLIIQKSNYTQFMSQHV